MTLLQRLIRRRRGPGSLGRRMAKAGVWTLGESLGMSALRLGSNLITTRLLLPEAFGLIAIVVAIEMGCRMFTDLGLSQSVQREADGDSPRFLRVIWSLQLLLMGGVSAVILCIAAALALAPDGLFATGTVYADPVLPGLVAASALLPLLRGFNSSTEYLAARNLNFRILTILRLSAYVLSLIAMLSLLYHLRSVWVLLGGIVLNAGLFALLSHLILPGPRMRLEWDRQILGRVWRFGRYVVGSSPLSFVAQQGDRFLLGALLDATTFGYYAIAVVWISALRALCGRVIQRVGFAGLSEMQRTAPEALPRKLARLHDMVSTAVLALFLATALGGHAFVALLYPARLAPVADFFVLLSLLVLFTRNSVMGQYLLVAGESGRVMILAALRAAGLIVLTLIGYRLWGPEGAVAGVVASGLVHVPVLIAFLARHLPAFCVRREAGWFALSILATGVLFSAINL